MKINTGVFERQGNDTMGLRAFLFCVGFVVLWGLAGTALIARHVAQIGWMPGTGAIIVLGLVIPIIGIIIAVKSENPLISFVGYHMVLVPFGVILGPMLAAYAAKYSPQLIQNAFLITALDTAIMCILATLFPNFFSKLGGALFAALLGLLVVRVVQMFIPGLDFGFVDWIGAGIFSLYIGYDYYRATTIQRTLDNAVDIGLDLYLDIINLFLTILRILARSESDD